MKTLIFTRHAKPLGLHSGIDATRPLSFEGREVQKILLQQIKEHDLHPTKIYTSPFLRAVQSAKILADSWGLPIVEEPALCDHFDAEKVLEIVKKADENAVLLFAGHAGAMEQLIETLAGQPILPAGLSKSGAAVLFLSKKFTIGKQCDYRLLNPGAIN